MLIAIAINNIDQMPIFASQPRQLVQVPAASGGEHPLG
jgi:hypothetical protein